MKLEGDSEVIDPVRVSEVLGKRAKGAGSLACIGGLANNTAGSVKASGYAKIVQSKAIERNVLNALRVSHGIILGDCETGDKVDRCVAAILKATEDRQAIPVTLMSEAASEAINRLDTRMKSVGGMTGLKTGFDSIDQRTAGLQKGDLIIVAGRPGMGKTCLALNIAENVAIDSRGVAMVFSLEMPTQQLTDRTICNWAEVDNALFRTGQMGDDELTRIKSALKKISDTKLVIDETGDINVLQIKSRARKVKTEHGLDLIVIDYLQLLNTGLQKGESQTAALGRVTRQLKIAAKELDVPIILLSLLNRSCEARIDKRPLLSDLRDSGSIEQDVDVVMFVYRDAVYNDNSVDQDLAEIITAKFRNGQTGWDTLEFQGRYIRFSNTPHTAQSRGVPQKRVRFEGFE